MPYAMDGGTQSGSQTRIDLSLSQQGGELLNSFPHCGGIKVGMPFLFLC